MTHTHPTSRLVQKETRAARSLQQQALCTHLDGVSLFSCARKGRGRADKRVSMTRKRETSMAGGASAQGSIMHKDERLDHTCTHPPQHNTLHTTPRPPLIIGTLSSCSFFCSSLATLPSRLVIHEPSRALFFHTIFWTVKEGKREGKAVQVTRLCACVPPQPSGRESVCMRERRVIK